MNNNSLEEILEPFSVQLRNHTTGGDKRILHQAIQSLITSEQKKLIEKIERLICEHEPVDSLGGYNVPTFDDVRLQAAVIRRNQLRQEVTTILKQLREEL